MPPFPMKLFFPIVTFSNVLVSIVYSQNTDFIDKFSQFIPAATALLIGVTLFTCEANYCIS